jgi:hypothetical protein
MKRSTAFSLALCGLLLQPGAEARAPDKGGVQLLAIEVRCGPADGSSGPGGRHMRKFMEEMAEPVAVVEARWRAPAAGLPPGVMARLDVRRSGSERTQSFEISYPGALRGETTTIFRVPRIPGRAADGIDAWRVQIVQAGKLLAEQSSGSWR